MQANDAALEALKQIQQDIVKLGYKGKKKQAPEEVPKDDNDDDKHPSGSQNEG